MSVRQFVPSAQFIFCNPTAVITPKTGSTLAVVGIVEAGTGSLSAPTDNLSQTYHLVDNYTTEGNYTLGMWYAFNVAGVSTTLTSVQSGFCTCIGCSQCGLFVFELDAPVGGGDPLDTFTAFSLQSGNTTNWTNTATTTTAAQEVAVSACWSIGSLTSITVGPTWPTGIIHPVVILNSVLQGAVASEVLSATGSVKADFNVTPATETELSAQASPGHATFKSAIPANVGSFFFMDIAQATK